MIYILVAQCQVSASGIYSPLIYYAVVCDSQMFSMIKHLKHITRKNTEVILTKIVSLKRNNLISM